MNDEFIHLFPLCGFTDLNPSEFQELMDIIRQEPDLYMQRFYFGQVMHRLFGGHEIIRLFQASNRTYHIIPAFFQTYGAHWGWFLRLGQTPWRPCRAISAASLSDDVCADALKVLRMVRQMHYELKYQSSYIDTINWFIREFDAPQSPAKEAPFTQESVKTVRAMVAFNQGQKVPRKLKKHIKKLMQKSR